MKRNRKVEHSTRKRRKFSRRVNVSVTDNISTEKYRNNYTHEIHPVPYLYLAGNVISHANERLYRCQMCGECFAYSYCLAIGLLTRRSGDPNPQSIGLLTVGLLTQTHRVYMR